jgi:hypothetical protein
MGCRILRNESDTIAELYCSTSDWAFGPVFYAGVGAPASERAKDFLLWLKQHPQRDKAVIGRGDDPREYTSRDLQIAHGRYLASEADSIVRSATTGESHQG